MIPSGVVTVMLLIAATEAENLAYTLRWVHLEWSSMEMEDSRGNLRRTNGLLQESTEKIVRAMTLSKENLEDVTLQVSYYCRVGNDCCCRVGNDCCCCRVGNDWCCC